MTEGFKKLVAVCRDKSYRWWSFCGGSGTQTLSRKIEDENGGFSASPLDVAAGVRLSMPYTSGTRYSRCRELGLTTVETAAACEGIFQSRILEGWKESLSTRELSLEEFKEFLQLHARLRDAFGWFDQRDYKDALRSIGLGKK